MTSVRDERRSLWSARELASTWRTWLPFAFVIFSLLTVLLTPILLERRIRGLREDVSQVIEPARTTVRQLQIGFARQASVIRSFLLQRDQRFLRQFAALRTDERQAFQLLDSLTAGLDPAIEADVRALHSLAEAWAAEQTALLSGTTAPDSYLRDEDVDGFQANAIQLARELDERLSTLSSARRADARQLEQLRLRLTLALGALALLSAVIVGWSGHRFRQRAREEYVLRQTALTLTAGVGVEDVLHRIVDAACRLSGAISAYVERIDAETREVHVVAAEGPSAPAVGTRSKYPGSLTAAAIETGTPEIVSDVTAAGRPMMEHVVKGLEPGGSVMAIPLIAERTAQGGLVLVRNKPEGKFRASQVQPLQVFGVLAALALRKAILFEESEARLYELQRANDLRSRLLRGFSHDIKNPLGAADGHAALLEEDILDDEQRRQGALRIRTSIQSALALISDLVDLARAEAGQLEVRCEKTDVPELVESLVEEFHGAAKKAGIALRPSIVSVPAVVETDPQRVRQILGNLVSNAIKYTPSEGNVTVEVKAQPGRRGRDPGGWITISVCDTGPGISESERNKLFREFSRVHEGPMPGVGLGLAISQRLAALLGGEISVTSEVGAGSTFTLWLPDDCNTDAS